MDFKGIEDAKSVWIYGYGNLGRNVFNKFMILWSEKTEGIVVLRDGVMKIRNKQ